MLFSARAVVGTTENKFGRLSLVEVLYPEDKEGEEEGEEEEERVQFICIVKPLKTFEQYKNKALEISTFILLCFSHLVQTTVQMHSFYNVYTVVGSTVC